MFPTTNPYSYQDIYPLLYTFIFFIIYKLIKVEYVENETCGDGDSRNHIKNIASVLRLASVHAAPFVQNDGLEPTKSS